MRGFPVRGGRQLVAIHLDQDKTAWVISLLDHIRPGDAGFPNAVAGIFNGCFAESLNELRFDVNMDMDNEHAPEHPASVAVAQARR